MRDSELIVTTQEWYLHIIAGFLLEISSLLFLMIKTQLVLVIIKNRIENKTNDYMMVIYTGSKYDVPV